MCSCCCSGVFLRPDGWCNGKLFEFWCQPVFTHSVDSLCVLIFLLLEHFRFKGFMDRCLISYLILCGLFDHVVKRFSPLSVPFQFAKYRFSIRKVQIFNSQSTDFQFAKYRFSIRKVQISQFAKYRFPNSFRFVSFRFAKYSKPNYIYFTKQSQSTKHPFYRLN